jgi:hypothetical protein
MTIAGAGSPVHIPHLVLPIDRSEPLHSIEVQLFLDCFGWTIPNGWTFLRSSPIQQLCIVFWYFYATFLLHSKASPGKMVIGTLVRARTGARGYDCVSRFLTLNRFGVPCLDFRQLSPSVLRTHLVFGIHPLPEFALQSSCSCARLGLARPHRDSWMLFS